MSIGDIIRPDEDVEIEHEFSGSIRCRRLTVLEGGSVAGAVVAERVEVKGALTGVVDCDYFVATPSAVVRGTIFSPHCVTCSIDGVACDSLVLHSTKRQSIFQREVSGPALKYEEIIHSAIDEVVSKRLQGSVGKTEERLAVPVSNLDEISGPGLLERLASKGLTSLLPVVPEPDMAIGSIVTDEPESTPDRPTTAIRTPLPSLV